MRLFVSDHVEIGAALVDSHDAGALVLLPHHLNGTLGRLQVELIVLLALSRRLLFLCHRCADRAFAPLHGFRLLATHIPILERLSRPFLLEAVTSPGVLLGHSSARAIARLSLEGTRIALGEDAICLLVGALGLAAHAFLHHVHLTLVFLLQLSLQTLILDVLELAHRKLWLLLRRQLCARHRQLA